MNAGQISLSVPLMKVFSGGQCLMIDEDTAATNFMVRDDKIQMLLSADKEPIKPYLYRARELYDRFVLVLIGLRLKTVICEGNTFTNRPFKLEMLSLLYRKDLA
jgi:predicted ABC-class ATPase